jgi:serine/threonine-protein kinase
MEYLDGSDLATLIRTRGPLPVAVAAEYLLQACEAIAEAHAMGIVHRDLKPSNLFITTRPDGSPAIKVIDFGISKITPRSGEAVEMTKTADVRGSPLFMSPEQMTSPRAVDARTDIWAIGVTLYNLLTGGYPFYSTAVPELCGLILQAEPAPLRMRRPDLPVGLDAMIARCLRKNPAERYANIAELAAALGEFAPPLARLSVDRIYRVLGASAVQGRGLLPSAPAHGSNLPAQGEPPTAPFPPRASLPSTSAVASPGEAPQGTTMQAQTGAVSWGSNRSPAKKHTALIVLGLSFIGAAAGAAILWVVRVDRHSLPDSSSASALPDETAQAAPSPAAPTVDVVPSEAQPAAPAASVQAPSATPIALPPPAASSAPLPPAPAPQATSLKPVTAPAQPIPAPKKKTPARTEPF